MHNNAGSLSFSYCSFRAPTYGALAVDFEAADGWISRYWHDPRQGILPCIKLKLT